MILLLDNLSTWLLLRFTDITFYVFQVLKEGLTYNFSFSFQIALWEFLINALETE